MSPSASVLASRLLYTYPYKFSDDMIDAVARLERVIPYVDMPVQHIHDRMLRRMGRRMGEAGTRELFRKMRERIPDLVLRTTFIVGFPGETEEEFRFLVDFVREERIERVGVFGYSDEDGTPATRLSGKVLPEVTERRIEELMLAQQEVAFAWNAERLERLEWVLIDGVEEGGQRLHGRSYAEAPEIDSKIFLPLGSGEVGEYVEVRITSAEEYDLIAQPLNPSHRRPGACPSPATG